MKKINQFDRLIFLPFPLGVGNDLSIMLNFGGNMDVYYLDEFFRKMNSSQTKEYQIDTWLVTFNFKDKKVEKLMLNYFGLGCDAQVAKSVDILRKRYPFLFRINKITRLFYMSSWFKNLFNQIYYGKNSVKFTNMELELDGKKQRINHLANLVVLNSYSRQGGIKKEWDNLRTLPKYKDRDFKPWSD